MIRVLHYIPGFRNGGIESRLLDWYHFIDRDNIHFSVIKLNEINDSDNAKKFLEMGGIFYNIPPLTLKNTYKYFFCLFKLIDKQNFDILHVHDLNSGLFPLIIAMIKGIKVRIFHSRTNNYLYNEKNIHIKKVQKSFIKYFANVNYACSKHAGLFVFGRKGFRIIKNGINIDKYISVKDIVNFKENDDQIILGTICRISTQKNLLFLIEVFYKFNLKHRNSKLIIVGEGDDTLLLKLKKFVEELDLKNNVEFFKNQYYIERYYKGFDIFIGTSIYEGFGTTAVEAQCSGIKSVVSTGFPEDVVITKNIKRIELNSGLEKWVKCIEELLILENDEQYITKIINSGYVIQDISKLIENEYITYYRKEFNK